MSKTYLRFSVIPLLAVLAAFGPGAAAAADLTIVTTVRNPGDQSLSSRTLYVTEGRIRIAEAKADGIMEAATGRIVVMDHAKKEYYETSFEEVAAWQKSRLERFAPKSGLARKIYLRSLSDMPKTNVKRGKGNRTIAGYACDQYLLQIGKEDGNYAVWATAALQPPAAYYDLMIKLYTPASPMGAAYAESRKRKSVLLGETLTTARAGLMDILAGGLGLMGGAASAAMTGAAAPPGGMPTGEKTETLAEASEVKTEPIPGSVFEIPGDYAKKDSPFKTARS